LDGKCGKGAFWQNQKRTNCDFVRMKAEE